MRRIFLLLAAVAVVTLASGCLTVSGGVAPSTRPIDSDQYTTISWTEGSSWGVTFLTFFPLSLARTQDAIDEALAKNGGDFLVNVSVDNQHFYTFLFNVYRVKVEGMAANLRPQARVEVQGSDTRLEVTPR